MAYDEQMALKFRRELAKMDLGTVHEKYMFGALGFMVNGKLAACVGDKDVMYRLGSERCKKLIEQGAAEPVIMGKRTMKHWVNVYFHNLENSSKFDEYLSQSINFTVTKPTNK